MKIETLTYIEVENVPNIWAILLDECKMEMNPVRPKFIFVYNDLSSESIIHIENILTDIQPEKIINGEFAWISDTYIEVGFWKIKHKIIRPEFPKDRL